MPPTASRPNVTPPTLFRLKNLPEPGKIPETSDRKRPTRAPYGATASSQNGVEVKLAGDRALVLRIDGPHSGRPSLETTAEQTQPHLDTLADTSHHQQSRSGDLFSDHAGDLICSLSQWSMKLDRRESELDHRERDLNQRLRMLRQHPSAE